MGAIMAAPKGSTVVINGARSVVSLLRAWVCGVPNGRGQISNYTAF
jgi:hypothetical protein